MLRHGEEAGRQEEETEAGGGQKESRRAGPGPKVRNGAGRPRASSMERPAAAGAAVKPTGAATRTPRATAAAARPGRLSSAPRAARGTATKRASARGGSGTRRCVRRGRRSGNRARLDVLSMKIRDLIHYPLHLYIASFSLSSAVMRSGWCNIRRRGSILALIDSVVVVAQRMLANGLSEAVGLSA